MKEGEYSEGIYFKIEKVRSNNGKENFDAKIILEDGTAMLYQMEFTLLQSQNRTEQEQEELDQETKDLETLLKTFTEEKENQQNQNSSQDNNVVPKQVKRRSDYSNTKVKARTFLTNVAYRRFKQSDFMKDSFVIDILSFLVQNCKT